MKVCRECELAVYKSLLDELSSGYLDLTDEDMDITYATVGEWLLGRKNRVERGTPQEKP